MKWIALLLQLVSFRSSLLESRALLENARSVAEKGKRAALFSAFFLLALVYFLVGSILAVVEIGLQVDRGLGLHFSGLLGASLALMLIAGLIVGAGALASSARKAPPEPSPREPDIRTMLEELLVTFLSQLTSKLKDKPEEKDESRS
jgi:hypothetical protein